MVYQQSEKHGPPTKGRNVCPLRLRYPGPRRGECKIQTNLLIGDGSVLERLRSPVGGLDDLTSEMLQLQHKREGDSVSRDGWSQQAVCVWGGHFCRRGPGDIGDKGPRTCDGHYRLLESPRLSGRGGAHRRDGERRVLITS